LLGLVSFKCGLNNPINRVTHRFFIAAAALERLSRGTIFMFPDATAAGVRNL
jgi:hypothetical protein